VPSALPEADPREQIFRLEHEIERLGESVEWCRKIAFAARVAIGAGVVLLAAILFGPIEATGLTLMIAAILTLGGIVLAGSNGTTAQQTADRLARAEQQRAELIGAIELTLVPEPSRLLH
jgi:hypothetical protein